MNIRGCFDERARAPGRPKPGPHCLGGRFAVPGEPGAP
jgi:hypothetical protein